ncbi:hypothetical protein G7Y89_g14417 [Cudoniella acicularis]|uniref:Uncharacterized protein n=1 Tax=Cudoniella acicularis TaxID=354080 RepID=A0A8H4VT92_9HELO|nr:hypothetical protein G7Y89_g14417 [Cudoniella acicularis]
MASHAHEHGQAQQPSADLQWTDEQLSKLISPPPADKEPIEPAENGPSDTLRDEEAPEISGDSMGDMYFEAAEHESVVFGVKLKNIHNIEIPATDHEIWTWNVPASNGMFGLFRGKKQVKLGFGRIIALAGDFYSTHEDDNRTPICGAFTSGIQDVNFPPGFEAATRRFRSAVQSLKDDTDRNLVQINDLMDAENHGVDEAQHQATSRNPQNPIYTIANAYHNHECGIPTNTEWWKATMGLKNPKAGLFTWLCYINADHFGSDAVTAYKVGHNEAMRLARSAGQKSSDRERADAFALHYLSDLFSSGHLRTPRRQLHNDRYDEQSMSAARIASGKGEVPIWDFQANYMHDNDSDTGLLVRNELGHQWLCYGDKQFKESWDIVNRARIMHCIQASVTELFQEAFVKNRDEDPNSFIALKLIPQPMLSAGSGPSTDWKSQGWGNYDMHNPAPLWQVNSENNKHAWTMRANINDHSIFERRDATPRAIDTTLGYPKASQECWDAKDSSFRTQGAAPTARPIEGLTSGGFFQIQDLNPGGNQIHTCVNFWGPVSVTTYDRQGQKEENQTFTLRNRIVDFDIKNNSSSVIPLHSTKWHDGNSLSLYRVNLQTGPEGAHVSLSGWSIKNNSPSAPNEPVTFNINHSWAFEAQNRFKDVLVAKLPPTSHANLIRTVMGNFADQHIPSLAVLCFSPAGSLNVSLVADGGSQKIPLTPADLKGVYSFAKRLRVPYGLDQVLLVLSKELGDHTEISLDRIAFGMHGTTTLKGNVQIYKAQGFSQSLLVGDVLDADSDQAVVLLDGPNEQIITVYDFPNGEPQEKSQNRFAQALSSSLIRPYFNALIPTEHPDGTTSGLSILQVSLHNINTSPCLIFRLTDTKTWTTLTSKPIPDTLASDPHYFHIKFLRCSRSSSLQYSTRNAIMEIFSFYGVLGIRRGNGTRV